MGGAPLVSAGEGHLQLFESRRITLRTERATQAIRFRRLFSGLNEPQRAPAPVNSRQEGDLEASTVTRSQLTLERGYFEGKTVPEGAFS